MKFAIELKFIIITINSALQHVTSPEIMKTIVSEGFRWAVFSNAFIVFITLGGNKENK